MYQHVPFFSQKRGRWIHNGKKKAVEDDIPSSSKRFSQFSIQFSAIVFVAKKMLLNSIDLWPFEPFLGKKKHLSKPTYRGCLLFFQLFYRFKDLGFIDVVFLQRLKRRIFCSKQLTPRLLGTEPISGCSRHGRIELVGCEPPKFVGNAKYLWKALNFGPGFCKRSHSWAGSPESPFSNRK